MNHFSKSLTVLLHAIAITVVLASLGMADNNSQRSKPPTPTQLIYQTEVITPQYF